VTRGRRALRIDPRGRMRAAARAGLAVAALFLLMWPAQALARKSPNAEAPPVTATWSMNLFYAPVVRYQNPDLNGCTAASTVSMLDLIALTPQPDQPPPRGAGLPANTFQWTINTSWNQQERVMWFERAHMSMSQSFKGSDPHGWRNGLNYFGWGSMNADVYRDTSYKSFSAAAHAVVDSIARTDKPAGILGWAGSHAQYVTGYSVQGEDPRVSDNYTIIGVYLSDPLRWQALPTTFISLWTWKNGSYRIRFAKYTQAGSTKVDPIDGKVGDKEWQGKWVVIEPVR
jgi:hypothetical protein